ncbi:MAG: phosphoribosylanthranilate isomerase [Bacteroidales bacterium]|nr:phosphoribosylanthranilate isomerase [Bacteroidales bacterium]
MKIKVCGMRDVDNIAAVAALSPDYMGFIFYEQSSRYAGALHPDAVAALNGARICTTGVFVNASAGDILAKVKEYGFRAVQLHGNESPVFCESLRAQGIVVVKSFPVSRIRDFAVCAVYESACDYFLFDTKTPSYGGSGTPFDWGMLAAYTGKTPFFLSGGIGANHAQRIKMLQHPMLYAIDVNSRFETSPGVKDLAQVRHFIGVMRQS